MPRRPSALVRPHHPQQTWPGRARALLLEGGRQGAVRGASSGPGLQVRGPLGDEPSCLGPDGSCRRHPRPPALDGVSGGLGLSVLGAHSHRGSLPFPGPEHTGVEGVWRGPATHTQRRPGGQRVPCGGYCYLRPPSLSWWRGSRPLTRTGQHSKPCLTQPRKHSGSSRVPDPAPLLTAVPWPPGPSPPAACSRLPPA